MKATNIYDLNGSDWRLSGWMRHQWKFQKLMETDSFSLPVVTAKDTSVGGTSISSNEPDIESFPPIEGRPNPFWAL